MITSTTYVSNLNPGIIQFENANEGRSYPFDDNVVIETIDGKRIPDTFIADLHLVVPTGCDAFLSSIYRSDRLVSACIKIFKGTAFNSALSVFVSSSSFEAYRPYRLEKLTGSEDVGGIITFGHNPFAEENRHETYRFADRKIRVVDSAVSRYVPAGLRKLIDDRTGDFVYGDVKLKFSDYVLSTRTENGAVLYLKDGAAEALASSCDKDRPVNPCGATPVTSINGIEPDDKDRIVIWFH